MQIYASSREYVTIPVVGVDATGTRIDLSGDAVAIAAVLGDADATPEEADWLTASWAAAGQATILIGPDGDVELTAGLYQMFVRVTDNPEAPVLRSGALRVT